MKKTIFILFLSIQTSFCCGQNSNKVYGNELFLKGIYLEDKDVQIPWDINYTEIDKYAKPKLSKSTNHKNWTLIKWDSVTILNGIILSLQLERPNKIIKTNSVQRTPTIISFIDSATSEKLFFFFKNHTKKNGYAVKSKETSYTRWIINGRRVFVGLSKKYGYLFWTDA